LIPRTKSVASRLTDTGARHVTSRSRLLAYIYVVTCGAWLAIGLIVCIGLMFSRDPSSRSALQVVGGRFIAFSIFYFLPGFLAGIGLLRGKQWARTVLVVLSLLVILLFPVGTALGGFGLWVLLGRDAKQVSATPSDAPQTMQPVSSGRLALSAGLSRHGPLLAVMAGVAALFVVMIGTGFRLTHTPASPINNSAYFAAIGVLVLLAGVALTSDWFRTSAAGGLSDHGFRGMSFLDRQRLARRRRQVDAERRARLAVLAADPVRRKYVERIQRGESWSDEQIEYAEHPQRLATCVHLQPIEHELRATGIPVRLVHGSKVSARCCVEPTALAAQFALPDSVHYAEPTFGGRSYEDAPSAVIVCDQCHSTIHVVHRLVADADTAWFPSSASATGSPPPPVMDDITALKSRITQLAREIDVPDHVLPTFGYSEQNGRPHIELRDGEFHLVMEERGQEYGRFTTTSLDDLLYRVFRDATYSAAAARLRVSQLTSSSRRAIFRDQVALLERVNPEWAKRREAEP
jgi:immunity protein 63 of polymorphic toxin system